MTKSNQGITKQMMKLEAMKHSKKQIYLGGRQVIVIRKHPVRSMSPINRSMVTQINIKSNRTGHSSPNRFR